MFGFTHLQELRPEVREAMKQILVCVLYHRKLTTTKMAVVVAGELASFLFLLNHWALSNTSPLKSAIIQCVCVARACFQSMYSTLLLWLQVAN